MITAADVGRRVLCMTAGTENHAIDGLMGTLAGFSAGAAVVHVANDLAPNDPAALPYKQFLISPEHLALTLRGH
jgi:hypothetical protein